MSTKLLAVLPSADAFTLAIKAFFSAGVRATPDDANVAVPAEGLPVVPPAGLAPELTAAFTGAEGLLLAGPVAAPLALMTAALFAGALTEAGLSLLFPVALP